MDPELTASAHSSFLVCQRSEVTPLASTMIVCLTSGHAPGLWELEVSNLVLSAERRGRLSEAASARIVERLRDLPIRLSPNSPGFTTCWRSGVSTG
jgi:hypothetical protein